MWPVAGEKLVEKLNYHLMGWNSNFLSSTIQTSEH